MLGELAPIIRNGLLCQVKTNLGKLKELGFFLSVHGGSPPSVARKIKIMLGEPPKFNQGFLQS